MNKPADQPDSKTQPLVGIVGVCASGKSTLIAGLNQNGVRTSHIAQEHSYVKDMWKRIANPDILILLDVSYPVTVFRRQINWNEADWAEQQKRLLHARQHADLIIQTDHLSPEDVLKIVIEFIENL